MNQGRIVKYSGCCGSTHAKVFEIILIIGFSSAIALLTINLVLTMWFFKFAYSIFYIQIGLMALNLFSIIFSIILRVWRSNGSVLSTNFSSSNCISIMLLVFIIMNLLASLAEEVFISLVLIIYTKLYMNDENENIDIDEAEKLNAIMIKFFNKIDDYDDSLTINSMEDYEKFKKKFLLTKIFSWISISYNLLIQIITLVYIILLIKRIKNKTDFGVPSGKETQFGQQSSIQNNLPSNRNLKKNLGNNDNNIFSKNIKNYSKKKKSKKKKSDKKEGNELFSNIDSDQVQIMKKKKVKKKSRKKRNQKTKK